ncbi:glycoside hydrolase family 31 protein, partial [Aplosporella prunicola CBS 121167]
FLSFASPRGEQWFGFGGLAGLGDLRGQRIPILTREAGVGRGAPPLTHLLNSNASLSGAFAGGSLRTAYTAIGAGTTSHGRWLALAGAPALTVLDLASARSNGAANAAVNATANPVLSALTALSRRTGRQPRLPAWTAQGSILGIQGGQNKTAAIVQRALAAKTPLAAVWLQDWSGARLQPGADYAVPASRLWWNWEADAERYPQWATWVPALRGEHGVRVLSYVNTFLADVSAKTSGWERNLFEEGSAKGLLVGNKSADDGAPWRIESGPGIDAGLLDLSNEAAVRWFKQVLKDQFYSVPISGMMQDFGEYLPTDADAQLGGDVDPRLFHNAYPAAWAKLLREVVEELDLTDEQLGFHRSATTFSGPHTNLFWAGDQNVDTTREDGMRAAASTALQMGFSGWGQIHSDVGGYTTTLSKKAGNVTRDAALLGRWGEMVALTDAVMRSHEGNIPDVNAQAYDNASTLAYWAYNSRLFVSVAQYRAQLLDEYHDRGWPVARHPVVYAPGDARAQSVVDEAFWVGEALLLAPVYEVWEQKVEVYLPHFQIDSEGRAVPGETKYRHLWSGEEYAPGQSVVVDAPWGRPGVFVRWPLKESEEETLKGLFEFVEKERETVLSV